MKSTTVKFKLYNGSRDTFVDTLISKLQYSHGFQFNPGEYEITIKRTKEKKV